VKEGGGGGGGGGGWWVGGADIPSMLFAMCWLLHIEG
jgi:hypothetical protein